MIDYNVQYVNENGDKQSSVVTAKDVRTAINNALELLPDAKRIIRCAPKPMFDD